MSKNHRIDVNYILKVFNCERNAKRSQLYYDKYCNSLYV